MKARDIILHAFYMYQIYVMVLMGLIFPISNVSLSFALLLSAASYFTVAFVSEKHRKIAIISWEIILIVISWLTQPDVMSRILMMVYHLILMLSYYRSSKIRSIQPVPVVVMTVAVIIVAYALNYFTNAHQDIAEVYNALLVFMVIGFFASAVYNMDVLYKLSFVNVLSNASRETIERIILAATVVMLLLHRYLFSLSVEVLLIFGLIILYILSYGFRASVFIFSQGLRLFGSLFPNLFKPAQLEEMVKKAADLTDLFGDTTEYVSRHAGKSNVDVLAKIILFLLAAGIILLLISMLKKRKDEEFNQWSNGVTTVKALEAGQGYGRKKKRRKFSSRMTEIRRKYKKTVRRLLRKHYEFPEHITANEFLTTVKREDVDHYDFADLTALYNEDRYGSSS